jgi:HAD superfamily hydrolase (TIGR01484 family)
VRPLVELSDREAVGIDTVVFDLDDTVLDHGALSEEAYVALHRLHASRLELVACTGRPAGWAEIVLRQWPIDAAIAENGAVYWQRVQGGRVTLVDPLSREERAERRARLSDLARELLEAHPALSLADDNATRVTDVTFDIGEHRTVAPDVVEAARQHAERRGVRTFISSVHLHITLDEATKATGFAELAVRTGRHPTRAFERAAFVGDSTNDAPAFAAFGLTFGVSNVARFVDRLPVPPMFVASRPMGRGFAEIAAEVISLRSKQGQ